MATFFDNDQDVSWMQRALKLARLGQGHVEPNPMVGCVIVRDGRLLAEGFHRKFGLAHAEVDALSQLASVSDACGATAYVTLEPCCHTGKTPPCTRALIASGIGRVVVAMRDPFPKVDGGGFRQLTEAGIRVDVGTCETEAKELNAPYLKRLIQGRPWVIAKWAMSIDGKIATHTGESQWISNELSRRETQWLRSRVDAIIVGGGTALADNPTLTARPPRLAGNDMPTAESNSVEAKDPRPSPARRATRIVMAGKRLPVLDSKIVNTLDDAPVLVFVNRQDDELSSDERVTLAEMTRRGIEVLHYEPQTLTDDSLEDKQIAGVRQLLDRLGQRGFTNVMVEGGSGLLASFSAAREIDEIHAFVAPLLIGGSSAPGPIGGLGWARLVDTNRFVATSVDRFDHDIRVILRRNPD